MAQIAVQSTSSRPRTVPVVDARPQSLESLMARPALPATTTLLPVILPLTRPRVDAPR